MENNISVTKSPQKSGNNNKSKFVGVRQRPSGKWVAEIKNTTQKIRMWLGTFDTAEEAARAYDEAACILRGSNTRTNFVNHHGPVGSALSNKIRNLLIQKKRKRDLSLDPNNNVIETSVVLGNGDMVGVFGDGYKPVGVSEINQTLGPSGGIGEVDGLDGYWNNVHDINDGFWDLPMLCQMFCPS